MLKTKSSLPNLSVLFEMAVCPCKEGQDVYCISVISDNENSNRHCSSDLSVLNVAEVLYPLESRACSDSQWDCKNSASLQTESTDRSSPCSVDIDIEKENLEISKSVESFEGHSMKAENALTKLFERKINIPIGGKIIQLLMNHNLISLRSTSRDKPTTERAHDTPNGRWRSKRAASFDSRKVVLLFSILSSMGSMMLIYLTLRVKQIGDGLVHV